MDGLENVTFERAELPESLLNNGNMALSGEFETVCGVIAVVAFGVVIEANIGLARTVLMELVDTLRRL